jgi:hypothetical protein
MSPFGDESSTRQAVDSWIVTGIPGESPHFSGLAARPAAQTNSPARAGRREGPVTGQRDWLFRGSDALIHSRDGRNAAAAPSLARERSVCFRGRIKETAQ